MTSLHQERHDELVARLTTGFGAMLEQVQELARKNTELQQILAYARKEAQYVARTNGSITGLDSGNHLQEEQDVYTEQIHRQSRSESGDDRTCLGKEDQENGKAIADGVEAWKMLTDGKGPLWRRHRAQKSHERQTREALEESPKQTALPEGHPALDHNTHGDAAECPFAAMAHLGEKTTPNAEPSMIQRPDLPPTPPHTQEYFAGNPPEDAYARQESPPPSVSGSISKCPIRMLDERSPEEIAQFFENHKHEIPRSHEVCVRRYQSNSQTIRELDAKYGNLANMIKGLGVKHQPLLPSKEDDMEDDPAMDVKSMRKVENWTHDVDVVHVGNDMPNENETHLSGLDHREGHFDRPFKEIRVGESPSRPWGISVPPETPPMNVGENVSTPTPKGAQKKAGDADFGDRGRVATGPRTVEPKDDKPRMLFTGPVFIGYGPEQAAAFLKEYGLKS